MKQLATRFCSGSLVRAFAASLVMLAASVGNAEPYNALHVFAGAENEGASPQRGALITDGTSLYGLTEIGGTNNLGTVFKVNPDGSGYQVLHSFAGVAPSNLNGDPTDGAFPYGSLLLIGSTLYGATAYGGAYSVGSGISQGCLFKINTDGSGFSLIHSFQQATAPDDGYQPEGSLVTDGTNLFGTTAFGANGSDGTVFAISTNGLNYQEMHDFAGTNSDDGSNPFGSLVLSAGVLYGMTYQGGSNSNAGTIFSINADGSGYQIIHSFTNGDGSGPWGSLIISNSTLYGMSSGLPGGYGTVFSVGTDGSNFQLLHSFAKNELYYPEGDLTLSNSTLYGMASAGGTNGSGSGGVFLINTDGTGYRFAHVFTFNSTNNLNDGSTPFGSLLMFNSQLYGMTSSGGSAHKDGEVFYFGPPIAGGLQVTILPDAVVTAGAQWQVDGGPLLNSGAIATNLSPGLHNVSFKPVAGWQIAPEQVVISARTTNVITATYTDPAVAVSSPTSKQSVSNGVFTATGTTSDDVAISGVYCQLNDGAWSAASTANNWTNWTATNLVLTPGTNVFRAYAMDASSNLSATNSVSFVYFASAPLIVNTIGPGTVTPNLNGAFVPIGKTVSMTAKADKGCVFVNWTGSTNSTRPKISFVAAPGLVFNANFRDASRPIDVVLSPKKNQVITNAAPVATGKASDNVGVTAVWFQVDGGAWIAANIPNGTNWTTPSLLPFLLSGPNTLKTFAQDAAGNSSLTNSVAFKYLVQPGTDWAPDSLNGLLAAITPTNGPESVGFDLSTFAQSGLGSDTNADDYGAGSYSYVKTDTNMAQLSLSFTNPPSSSNNLGSVTLVFTNHYAGYFTNDDAQTGGFDASIAPDFIPATVSGKTIAATSSQNGKLTTIKLSAKGTFVKTPSNNSNTGTSTGNYTFTRYSPVTGLFAFAFTDTADAGSSAYVQTTFTNATSGTYFVTVFDNIGTLQDTDSGRFILK